MTSEEKEARLKDIIWLRSLGSTWTWIGKKYGISRQAVFQIYHKWLDEQAAEADKDGQEE